MDRVAENVFVETQVPGRNPGLVVTSEGVVLIDTPLDLDFAKQWAKEIAQRGRVRYVINSENHVNHFKSREGCRLKGVMLLALTGPRAVLPDQN